ncbi:lipase [Mycena epipterygia]|nr:lipase [Mycena epipterygia]
MARLSAVVLAIASLANAVSALLARQAITALSSSQISAFKPYSFYAAAGYCTPAATLAWDCGTNCDANPSFQPIASGGDGDDIQFWYVGVDTALATVIVSHQGTDPSEFEADLTDVDFFLTTLNRALFPGLSSSIEVHNGFADEQASTATDVLAAVQVGLSKFGVKKVTLVGHGLGAALSLLDSVYLPLHLTGVTFQSILYGLPRVGNQAFANYASIGNTVTHINNKKDPIPVLPGMFLGFHQPTGEIHIQDSGAWKSCPGEDNPSTECSTGDVPEIFDGDLDDHPGPYDGVTMSC